MRKVLIAGSPDFDDYASFCWFCDFLLEHYKEVEIICGMGKGTSELAAKYAREREFELTVWSQSKPKGKAPINGYNKDYPSEDQFNQYQAMLNYADEAILFWNGHSMEVSLLISIAYGLNKRTHVIQYRKITRRS